MYKRAAQLWSWVKGSAGKPKAETAHEIWIHKVNCPHCGKRMREQELEAHFQAEHPLIKCEFCPTSLATKRDMLDHIRNMHGKAKQQSRKVKKAKSQRRGKKHSPRP